MRPWLAMASLVVLACSSTTVVEPGVAWVPVPEAHPNAKVDLLLMIDNSASMADKQELFAQSLPELIGRLITPNCVSKIDPTIVVARTGNDPCPEGSVEEFAPVSDMHLGVISSSMGGGGATDICDAFTHVHDMQPCDPVRHNDDKAHLLNRTAYDCTMANAMEGTVPDASPANFLAWRADGDPQQLTTDLGSLVRGAQEFGCGLEAQLESFYRFLVQPDPWDSIQLDTSQTPAAAKLVGVDATILQQRHDFLRPDSILAVVVLTDEEDSWSDPMWLGGRGWLTRAQNNTFSTTGQLPHGTTACGKPVDPNNPTQTGPNDPACQWCASKGGETDPNCATNKGLYSPKEDGLNVRYTNDMKRRYGMDPQFPVQRYVDGLTSALVPDTTNEHPVRKTCRNPIYARDLPTHPDDELCKLRAGDRTSDMVLFEIIGGVPWQLLTEDPANPKAPFRSQPTVFDWTRILGKDPATYQSDGIDPHMIESIEPRPGIACGVGSDNACDPMHGREWDTSTSKIGIDLEYACTFPLPKPKDCTKLPWGATCDCGGSYAGPLCEANPNDSGNLTLQTRAKAYPSIRELRVAKALGDGGVVASICPRTLDTTDPDFGYRPAVRALVDRMRGVFGPRCLPQALPQTTDGNVTCTILSIMPGLTSVDQPTACGPRGAPDARGLEQPDPSVLDDFVKQIARQAAADVGPGPVVSPTDLPAVCELAQITPDPGSCPSCTWLGGKPTCANGGAGGWCDIASKRCPMGSIELGAPTVGKLVMSCLRLP